MILFVAITTADLSASSWWPKKESFTNLMPSTPQWASSLGSYWSSLSPNQQRAAVLGTLALGGGGAYTYNWYQQQQRLAEEQGLAEARRLFEERVAQSASIRDSILSSLMHYETLLNSNTPLTTEQLNRVTDAISVLAVEVIESQISSLTSNDQQQIKLKMNQLINKIEAQKPITQRSTNIRDSILNSLELLESNLPEATTTELVDSLTNQLNQLNQEMILPQLKLLTEAYQSQVRRTARLLKQKINTYKLLAKFNDTISDYEKNTPILQDIIKLRSELDESVVKSINPFVNNLIALNQGEAANDINKRLESLLNRIKNLQRNAEEQQISISSSSGESEDRVPEGKEEEINTSPAQRSPSSEDISFSGLLGQLDDLSVPNDLLAQTAYSPNPELRESEDQRTMQMEKDLLKQMELELEKAQIVEDEVRRLEVEKRERQQRLEAEKKEQQKRLDAQEKEQNDQHEKHMRKIKTIWHKYQDDMSTSNMPGMWKESAFKTYRELAVEIENDPILTEEQRDDLIHKIRTLMSGIRHNA